MPISKSGKHFMNPQVMRKHEQGGKKDLAQAPDGADAAPDVEDGEPEDNEQVEPGAEEAIHAHLQNLHGMTGHAHSHIQHHPDGSHTTHHIGHDGEMQPPVEHQDTQEMVNHHLNLHGGY